MQHISGSAGETGSNNRWEAQTHYRVTVGEERSRFYFSSFKFSKVRLDEPEYRSDTSLNQWLPTWSLGMVHTSSLDVSQEVCLVKALFFLFQKVLILQRRSGVAFVVFEL